MSTGMTRQEIKAVTEYLKYHKSTDIKPVKKVMYRDHNGCEFPYFVFHFKDEAGDELSGIYEIQHDGYVTEEEYCPRADEEDMIRGFLNDEFVDEEAWSE